MVSATITPLPTTGRDTSLTGFLHLPHGWAEVLHVQRVGWGGDKKEVTSFAGPVLGETADVIVLQVYGEPMSFPLEQRMIPGDLSSPVSRHGWVVIERG